MICTNIFSRCETYHLEAAWSKVDDLDVAPVLLGKLDKRSVRGVLGDIVVTILDCLKLDDEGMCHSLLYRGSHGAQH